MQINHFLHVQNSYRASCCEITLLQKMYVGLRKLWHTKVDGRGTFKCLYLFTRILLYGLQRTTHYWS